MKSINWQTKRVNCSLCGNSESDVLWEKNSFWYVRCTKCSLVYVNPQLLPDEIARIYSVGYDSKTKAKPPKVDLLTHRSMLKFARPYRILNRWLDVGCFNGNLLLTAHSDGWIPFGTEISPQAVQYARSQGIDVYQGGLLDAHYPDDNFDVVTLNDVIEHLDKPLDYLIEIRRILRPGGAIYMDTPNFNSVTRFILGKEWSVFFPWHQHYFTRYTIKLMLSKARYREKSIRCIDLAPISRFNALNSFMTKGDIANTSGASLKAWLRRNVPFVKRLFFAVKDLGNLFFELLSSIGIYAGSKLIIVAEKTENNIASST